MKIRQIVLSLVLLVATLTARAEQLRCDLCGEHIQKTVYSIEDRVEGKKKQICDNCAARKERCFICDLPVRENFKSLIDGRYICARDAKGAIESDAEAKQVCNGVKDDLDRLLSRFLTMPGNNVELSIVDKFHLENLFHAPGYETCQVSIYGATASNRLPNGKLLHTIDILSYLEKSRLMAVCAHEYTHAWMNENVKPARKATLDKDSLEAFCELIAYKYMESRHEETEMANITHNHYTRGQINVLIEADSRYGFNTVMEWIKDGEDSNVSLANIDRIRSVKGGGTAPRAVNTAALLYVPPTVLSPVPDVLMLKGISGTGQRRFALINNATLETMERAKVRVGQTNVVVRCLEIRKDSVVVEVNGTGEKKELFIAAK